MRSGAQSARVDVVGALRDAGWTALIALRPVPAADRLSDRQSMAATSWS